MSAKILKKFTKIFIICLNFDKFDFDIFLDIFLMNFAESINEF